MTTAEIAGIERDELALSVARALAVANEAAKANGVLKEQSLVTITEQVDDAGRSWHVHYIPRDYINRRGGDLTVLVDETAGSIPRILRGQ